MPQESIFFSYINTATSLNLIYSKILQKEDDYFHNALLFFVKKIILLSIQDNFHLINQK